MAQVLIASRLSDGLVVFLAGVQSSGAAEWALHLDSALVVEDDARAKELLAVGEAEAARRQTILDPYLIEVVEEQGRLRPTKYREVIRCLGPTIRLDLGKQAEGPEA
jgi:hypothetical protein